MKILLACATFLALIFSALGAPAEDEVISLPGLKKQPPWKQYSGYLQASGSRRLHYWFIESANNPKSDPLALWMNGGPGCSSVFGLLSENGPYRVQEDGLTLEYNPQSWNSVANMLYLEAPAGVGFSYSDDKNYTTDDDQVAKDNYLALKDFFAKFPEFATNEFFITGESYGGIYVPTLSVLVMEDTSFNFQGFAIGNGVSSRELLEDSIIYFAYYHGLIGKEEWLSLLSVCCGGDGTDCKFLTKSQTSAPCYDEVTRVNDVIHGGSFDVYNLYNLCAGGVTSYSQKHAAILDWAFDVPPPPGARSRRKSVGSSVNKSATCTNDTALTTYTNLPEVRTALHIPTNVQKWQNCVDYGTNWYTRIYNDTSKFYYQLLNGGVVKPRGMWHYMDERGQKQVAGFVKTFDRITYATVRGSGHMVPTDRPRPALVMFTNFVRNSPFA
ncbi:hypothetical protein BaRGS_00021546 [Batillaria attramentaria]|uniref:Carboxypeptidase n=1 Tax=Batillaria attramentaria TaxID=370345 RepID=A0ABD0KJC9_9CAEN